METSPVGVTSVEEFPRVIGGYHIVRRLGHGSMGDVFEAIDPHGEPVALKMLRRFDAEMLRLLKAEFRGVQDIRHPNLVSLGELVSNGETCFFTMELVRGEDFRTAMRAPDGGFDEARLPDPRAPLCARRGRAVSPLDGARWRGGIPRRDR